MNNMNAASTQKWIKDQSRIIDVLERAIVRPTHGYFTRLVEQAAQAEAQNA